MVDANKLARAGCKYLGQLYSKMDCQAFVEKALSDCGNNLNLPGSNAWYRKVKDNGWVGTPEECKKKFGKIPVGAFLFILKQNGGEPEKYKKDGIGNASHIGIYTGMTGKEMVAIAKEDGVNASEWNYGDGAIHSSSTRAHVCTSTFKGKSISGGWNRIGLWNEVDYGKDNSDILKGTLEVLVGKVEGETIVSTTAVVKTPDGGSLNLRAKESTSSDRLLQIPDGARIEILEEGAVWSKVSYGGKTGYVMSKYLSMEYEAVTNDMVSVDRKKLEAIYDEIGDWLGLRG